jgi:hypothetical protein
MRRTALAAASLWLGDIPTALCANQRRSAVDGDTPIAVAAQIDLKLKILFIFALFQLGWPRTLSITSPATEGVLQ